jgi:hypothetical protein
MRLPALLLDAALPAPLLAADPPSPGEELFPLAVGNTWTYRVQPFFVPGQPPTFQDDRFVVRVVRKEMVGEQTCFVLEGKLKDRPPATEHVAFTRDGLTRFRADGVDITPPVTVLKFSAAPKAPWTTEYQLGDRKATATFTQEPVSITYQGKRTRTTSVRGEVVGENGGRTRPTVSTTVWYAAGVGMVRQTIDEGGKRPTLLLELEKFDKGE